jgi:hypothetical protein
MACVGSRMWQLLTHAGAVLGNAVAAIAATRSGDIALSLIFLP